MFGIKQKKQILLTGAFFLALVFSFSLNSNLHKEVVSAASGASGSAFDATASAVGKTSVPSVSASVSGVNDSCDWFSFGCWFMKALYGVLVTCAFFASVAAYMFSYVIDVSHFQAIMSNPVIWEMWKIVRDFMNLFFIFVLLLSAFYTIFQVDKYSYKNVLSKVIFGALFVNFSFPIARAIIDVGNVMMYSFIVDIFGMTGKSLTDGILGGSGLMTIFLPESGGAFRANMEIKFYFIAIICMFMFMVSFLTLALMMLFRLVVLPILVMFSPIGFVAGAIPGMDGYAKQWWDKLIKNVFFGPIAVFMMMIAVKFLSVWGGSNRQLNMSATTMGDGGSGTLISGVVYMAIPIIFFWIAITSAEKMSSEAGGLANSFGSKFLKKSWDWGKNKTIGAGKWAFKPEGAIGRRTYGGIIARRQAKNDEMKKYNEGIAKERLDALGKPGKDAAREKMDEADKRIIAKGAAVGASEKEKSSARIALKRLNDRKRAVNNEDIKKEKDRLLDAGAGDMPEQLLGDMEKINTMPRNKRERKHLMARAAQAKIYNESYARLHEDERESALISGDEAKSFIATDYDQIAKEDVATLGAIGTPARDKYEIEKLEYITEQGRSKAALSRLKGTAVGHNYTGTADEIKKARAKDRLIVEKFIKKQTNAHIKGGDGHETDPTNLS